MRSLRPSFELSKLTYHVKSRVFPFCRTGFPTIKIFPSSRTGKSSVKYPQDYQGERSGRAIVDHLVKMIPNDIQLVTSNPTNGKITNIDEFTNAEVNMQSKSKRDTDLRRTILVLTAFFLSSLDFKGLS